MSSHAAVAGEVSGEEEMGAINQDDMCALWPQTYISGGVFQSGGTNEAR